MYGTVKFDGELTTMLDKSVIEFMEPDEYMAWLAGRSDTEAKRANWAATLQKN